MLSLDVESISGDLPPINRTSRKVSFQVDFVIEAIH